MADSSASASHALAIQPILNGSLEHIADQILYRARAEDSQAEIASALQASTRVAFSAVYEIGLERLVGERTLLLTAPDLWVSQPEHIPVPADHLLLELPATVLADSSAPDAMARLQDKGFRLCLREQDFCRLSRPLLRPVDVIRSDIRQRQQPPADPGWMQSESLHLASFIENSDQLSIAQAAGFDWFQGFVFSLPVVIGQTPRQRKSNSHVEYRLLGLLASDDAPQKEIEALLAQHPSLAAVIMKQANSAALRRQGGAVDALSQALGLIGVARLRALVASFMVSSDDPIRSMQARQLLVRAGMASDLAERIASIPSDVAFTLALFSRLDVFEGQPLNELIRDLPFSSVARDALLERQGDLGRFLTLMDQFESGQIDQFSATALEMLNESFIKANCWADQWLTAVAGDNGV